VHFEPFYILLVALFIAEKLAYSHHYLSLNELFVIVSVPLTLTKIFFEFSLHALFEGVSFMVILLRFFIRIFS
jgi:hypothetical protein